MFYIMINRLDQVKKDFNSISKKGLYNYHFKI